MASAAPGGPGIAPGKHPTAERLWTENRELVCERCGHPLDWNPRDYFTEAIIEGNRSNANVWDVCKPCLDAMPSVSVGDFIYDSDGNPIEITGDSGDA